MNKDWDRDPFFGAEPIKEKEDISFDLVEKVFGADSWSDLIELLITEGGAIYNPHLYKVVQQLQPSDEDKRLSQLAQKIGVSQYYQKKEDWEKIKVMAMGLIILSRAHLKCWKQILLFLNKYPNDSLLYDMREIMDELPGNE